MPRSGGKPSTRHSALRHHTIITASTNPLNAEFVFAVPSAAVKTCSSCYTLDSLNSVSRQAVIYFQVNIINGSER